VTISRAVVCHPHPSYGGSPDNYPIIAIAEAVGVPALRPSLRPANAAAGLLAAIDAWTATESDDDVGGTILAAGWSFGADTCIAAAATDERIAAIALVAPTFRFCTADEIAALRARAIPTLVLEPSKDQITRAGTALAHLPDARIETIAGCDHYLAGYEDALAARVGAFTRELR
jgi:uncharacterized protein